MTRIRIMGIGSPLGDDQIGWRVIDALRHSEQLQRLSSGTSCEISLLTLDRPGPQLIQHLQDADIAILVDAIKSHHTPGAIHRIDNIERIENDMRVSSHGLGVASALSLARALDALPATLVLYAIEIDGNHRDASTSKAAGAAVPILATNIAAELAARLA
ncbi:MAG: hydrogenase maturation protease [Steroidobacteraceae bacterium]